MAGRPCGAPPPGSSSSGSSLSLFSYHALLVVESVIYRVPQALLAWLWPSPDSCGPALWPALGWGRLPKPARSAPAREARKGSDVDVSLDGKVALVTGAGPNIGSGIALALARYGAKVACNDVDEAAIKACIARIERNGGEAMAAPGDVTDEAAVLSYIAGVLDRWGHIDMLVNNAAMLGG